MGSELLWMVLSVLMGTYVLLFGFLRRANEWYFVSSLGEKKKSVPPGDMGWPLIGNMGTFFKTFRSDDPDFFIYNLVERYGRTGIYRTYLFGCPSVIVCLPETCRRVLMDDERFELGYPKSTTTLMGKKVFHGVSNAEHKRLRKLTTAPINGHEALSLYKGYIEEIVTKAMEEWASRSRPIEFLTETRKVAFKVIAHIFLGSCSESVIESMEKFYVDLIAGLKSVAINIPGFPFHRALKARKTLVKILQTVLTERRAMSKSNLQKCMADLMMEIEDEDGRKLADEDIVDLLLVFLLAGHDSSSHGAMWATLYLHQHPEVLEKAKEEQEDIIRRRPSNQKGLSLSEIRQMEYLPKVIDETLRRANISFCNFRRAKVDADINGYVIPKGWKVLIWTRGVHMDPEIYTEPKEFKPSRWDLCRPKPGAFIPFAGGSRICPGADLAKLEIAIFLHYFILNYKLEVLNPACPLVYLPLPRPRDNCLARVTKLP